MKLLLASTFILFSALLTAHEPRKLGADLDDADSASLNNHSRMILLPLASGAEDRKAWQFPQELRPQLQSRLERFLKAQEDGNWEEVAQMLGSYRRGNQYLEYTPEHKACFIAQMKTMPMVAFDFSVQESPFSSEIMFTPAGRRWWTLVGEGSFRKGAEIIKHRASLVAYRDQNDWYFTPPPFDDNAWAREHLGPEEIARDHGGEVELIAPPGFPIEVVDLHVFIDPEDPASRKVRFRLHNKADKRITAYSFEISDAKGRGSISVGTGAAPDAIEPGGLSRVWEENYAAYLYWCEGESPMRIKLQDVTFAGGASFSTNPPSTSDRQEK